MPPRSDDPSAIAKASKRFRDEEQKVRNFLEGAMKSDQGLAFLYQLLERCHCFQTAYTGEIASTNFKLGEQNIGLRLTTDLVRVSEAGYMEVLKYGQRRNRQPDFDDAGTSSGDAEPGDSSGN